MLSVGYNKGTFVKKKFIINQIEYNNLIGHNIEK